MPLDPIRNPDSFASVLQRWLERHQGMKTARAQYVSCLEKRVYTVARLVAAANMFDLLPNSEVPVPRGLPDDLEAIRVTALASLATSAPGTDRDSMKSALLRLGHPSLPKKVAHRWRHANGGLERCFPGLEEVLKDAIKCRNHFVHGPSKGFKYDRAEPFVHFLTDALEFAFAATDLVMSGWNPTSWIQRPYGAGHTFARFRCGYTETLAAYREAMAPRGKEACHL
jgi:hypothetical protein